MPAFFMDEVQLRNRDNVSKAMACLEAAEKEMILRMGGSLDTVMLGISVQLLPSTQSIQDGVKHEIINAKLEPITFIIKYETQDLDSIVADDNGLIKEVVLRSVMSFINGLRAAYFEGKLGLTKKFDTIEKEEHPDVVEQSSA